MKDITQPTAAIIVFSAATMMGQHGDRPGGGMGPGDGTGTTGTTATQTTDPATLAARQVTFLTQLLTLTTGQQTQATTLFTTAITADQALATQETTARTALLTAIKANNTAGIGTQAAAIATIDGQRIANSAKADAAFYALLTADQKTKLDSLNDDGFFGPGFGVHIPGGN